MITADDWREQLGEFRRVADWTELFRRQLKEFGTAQVVATWWPRLLPGAAGAGTHGLIRTAHALRASRRVGGNESLISDEIAHGFGYWAARYCELSSVPRLAGTKTAHSAFMDLPRLNAELVAQELGITARLILLRDRPEFGRSIEEYVEPGDIHQAFGDLTTEGANLFIDHATADNVFPLVHALTAPAAIRMSLESVPAEQWKASLATGWQLLAAIGSAFTSTATPEVAIQIDVDITTESLIATAVDHGDEHVIKFTEACIREYAIVGDSSYLYAASKVRDLI